MITPRVLRQLFPAMPSGAFNVVVKKKKTHNRHQGQITTGFKMCILTI